MSRDSRDYSSGRRKYEEEEPPTLYEIYKGEVVALQPYGAFIKLDGFRKNGLVHKTQISKARVDNPSEVLDLGDKVFCKVISLGEEGGAGKISLSMKVVNQDNGHDLDSNQVQTKQEEQRRQKGLPPTQDRIELGAVLNTTCRKCGMKGHLMQDCFHSKDGKTYDLIPDIDFGDVDQSGKSTNKEQSSTKKRKKKKKDRTREDRTREDRTKEDRTREGTTREEVHHNVERRKEREEQRHQSRLPSREANKDLGVGDKRKHSQRRGTPSDSDIDSDSSSGRDSKRRKDKRNRSSKSKEGHSASLEHHCKEVDQRRRKKKKSHKKDTRHSTDSSASSDDSTSSSEDEHRRKKKKKKKLKHSKSYKE